MGNFFNMIYGVLTKFNQNLNKNQDLNGYKLLTINLLDVNKDQLPNVRRYVALAQSRGGACFCTRGAMQGYAVITFFSRWQKP